MCVHVSFHNSNCNCFKFFNHFNSDQFLSRVNHLITIEIHSCDKHEFCVAHIGPGFDLCWCINLLSEEHFIKLL